MDGIEDLPSGHKEKLLETIERMQARDRWARSFYASLSFSAVGDTRIATPPKRCAMWI